MISDEERRDVAENLRYLADYPGAPVRYAEQFRDELSEVVLPDGFTHDYSELIQRLADLIEPNCDRDALLELADESKRSAWYFSLDHDADELRDRLAEAAETLSGMSRRIREALGAD